MVTKNMVTKNMVPGTLWMWICPQQQLGARHLGGGVIVGAMEIASKVDQGKKKEKQQLGARHLCGQ